MRIACIDLGSNSFHMLIVDVLGPTSFKSVAREKMMIQLGKTSLVTGRLDSDAMERGLECLDKFRQMAMARRVERIFAVATSAIGLMKRRQNTICIEHATLTDELQLGRSLTKAVMP